MSNVNVTAKKRRIRVTIEQSKRLDADVAAQLAGNILNLIQLGAGAEISASTKRDESAVDTVEESKRLDADVAAQIAANILNLIQLGIGARKRFC